jgi:hypothetical protein
LSIIISELRKKHKEKIKELAEFLGEKIQAKINVADKEISLEPIKKGEIPSKDYLKVLLRKFLHKKGLKDEFRVLAGKDNILIIKERKFREAE